MYMKLSKKHLLGKHLSGEHPGENGHSPAGPQSRELSQAEASPSLPGPAQTHRHDSVSQKIPLQTICTRASSQLVALGEKAVRQAIQWRGLPDAPSFSTQ